jgi:dTDP-4-amino-4,6-dideoxygalactose transaminase
VTKIPFNKPYLTGKETHYIQAAVASGHISGNGAYTKRCQAFFEQRYGIKKALLTTSCTDALEMAAILLDIKAGDEVIMPAYTFVSTANAFVLRGAKIVFCDSRKDHPGMDEETLEALITERTKAIVPVHYAGVACDMQKIMKLAAKYDLKVVEDAAHALESHYTFPDGTKKALGSIGHLAAFSFHETKNIISGEGGLLAINEEAYLERAEIIWEKGTNRSAFFRGEVKEYGWLDLGSSFLPSEVMAAFLWAQLEKLEVIQKRRISLWQTYESELQNLPLKLPSLPAYATNNGNMFYMLAASKEERDKIIHYLKANHISAVFHYLPLHRSVFSLTQQKLYALPQAEAYASRLFRIPFYFELSAQEQRIVYDALKAYFKPSH